MAVLADWQDWRRRPTAHPTIAACVIARDAQPDLAGCLESARPFVDELIVVDTGSKDRTVEIATEHGARVEHFAWCDDFGAARNACLDLATADWILSLDADERLDSKTAGRLQLKTYLPSAEVFCWTVTTHHVIGTTDLWGGWYELRSYYPRLFPRVPEVRWWGRVDEAPIHVGESPLLKRYAHSDIDVRHHGYVDEVVFARKQSRNRRLMEMRLVDDPDDSFALATLVSECGRAADWRRCLGLAQRYAEVTRGWRVIAGHEESLVPVQHARPARDANDVLPGRH